MAIRDIPVFREARRGQVVRSDDWNDVQRELRNGIRAHRHSRVASARVDDGTPDDLALQITTNEIADGAVTQAKLGSGVFDSLVTAAQLVTNGNGTESPRQVATDTVALAAQAREVIQHGLGRVPIAVTVAVRQRVTGLTGEFEVYGAAQDRGGVLAAVPVDPDGTFTLVSTSTERVSVRWWAVAGAAVAVRTVAQQASQAAPGGAQKRAPRRRRDRAARQE